MIIGDIEQALAIQSELKLQNWSYKNFLAEINATKSSLCWVAEDFFGRIIGYMIAQIQYDQVELLSIMVKPSFQRRGVAFALLKKLEKMVSLLVTHPFQGLYLEVSVLNQKALGFYKKNGFVKMGMRKNYYAQGDHALLMVKKDVL
ncbi:MAG: GNAT family N-acetyltransferase [Fibrobacter sp.]|nr:GNAT family N-acetyltransferase [Fibrobacter sp.]